MQRRTDSVHRAPQGAPGKESIPTDAARGLNGIPYRFCARHSETELQERHLMNLADQETTRRRSLSVWPRVFTFNGAGMATAEGCQALTFQWGLRNRRTAGDWYCVLSRLQKTCSCSAQNPNQ